MSLYAEFYDHGIDMSSEIPSSEKSDGFNVYWKANHSGKGAKAKAEARRAYNKGWKDYKSGEWEPAERPSGFGLYIGLAIVGLGIWLLLKNDKPSTPQPKTELPPWVPT
jgi:hypothetical protein